MASQDQSFSSNNPFRRKLGTPTISTDNPAAPSVTSFDGHFDSIPRVPFTTFKSEQPTPNRQDREDNEEVEPVQSKPKKIVKRVRVQSPPPSSPEDAVPVARFPPVSDDEDEDESDEDDDSNTSDSQDYEEHVGRYKTVSFPARDNDSDSTDHTQTGPPPNPFTKTLQDLEQAGQGQNANTLAASAAAKGALDVDSFKRLLLTGYANIPGPSSTSASGTGGNSGLSTSLQAPLHDGASNTDASSVSRQSIFDVIQDTPRTSHEISEPEDPEERRSIFPTSPLSSIPSSSTRKKPPPPSSRHGKLIKIELGADADSRNTKTSTTPISISTTSLPSIAPPRKSNSQSIPTLQQSPSLSTDVNKPLPQTPFRPTVEEAVDSPFDREAIGKVPEPFADIQSNPRPPTPPVVTRNRSASNGSTQARKPAAPPPRRHGRSDCRAPSVHAGNQDDDTPPRSSLDSNRSRTDSIRTNTTNAPAPPPPRRPNHARQGSSFTSPSQASFAPMSVPGLGITENLRSPTGTGFGAASNSGQIEDAGTTNLVTITTSKDGQPKLSPPPPPPTRSASTRRPPSVRSMDAGNGFGTGTTRRVSKEKEGATAPPPPPPPPRQRGSSRASVEAAATDGVKNPGSKGQQQPQPQSQQSEVDTKQGAEILADIDALQREVDALMGRVGKAGT
ncbi:hypothetical protein F4806DRAFT_215679 [Annulohypoxylon nitens]|nr:hypothetical protein F4806DRAFT_215679 [Annulohypoxylon nitens]